MTDDETVLELKRREIKALKMAKGCSPNAYFSGKAAAFSEAWELLLFNGRQPSVESFNKANEFWSQKAAES